MASSTRRYLNTVSIGDYEWIDEMKKDGRRRRICSSILEIIEQGDVVHVLDFELRLLGVKQGDEEIKEAFKVELKYLNGRLEKDIWLKYEFSLYKQNTGGNFELLDNFGLDNSSSFSKKKGYTEYFLGVTHNLTDFDFENHTKVKINLMLNLSIDGRAMVAPLTDLTAPTLEETMKSLCLNENLSDMKIVCDGQEFPCHKFILSARSDVFRTMFASLLKLHEKKTNLF